MNTYIEIEIHGTWVEVPVIVHADYQPEEAQTHNYPGCAESIEITGVELAVTSGTRPELLELLNDEQIESLKDQAIEHERDFWRRRRRVKLTPSFAQIAKEERQRALRESDNQRGVRI